LRNPCTDRRRDVVQLKSPFAYASVPKRTIVDAASSPLILLLKRERTPDGTGHDLQIEPATAVELLRSQRKNAFGELGRRPHWQSSVKINAPSS
jgi:hypothetical protein